LQNHSNKKTDKNKNMDMYSMISGQRGGPLISDNVLRWFVNP